MSIGNKRTGLFYLKVVIISTSIFIAALVLLVQIGVNQFTVAGWAKCYPIFLLIWIFSDRKYRQYKYRTHKHLKYMSK